MEINLAELRNNLKEEHIIKILNSLGADRYEEREKEIVFPTICHNPKDKEASMKLYYYKDSHMFHCYTECAENFDIFDLIKRTKLVNKENFDFYSTVVEIANMVEINIFNVTTPENYISVAESFREHENIELQHYDPIVLEAFRDKIVIEWESEGIKTKSASKFNIKYYDYQNKVVIPHYDINGNLIGIRGRALDPDEAKLYGKYAPIRINNIIYRHPLSFNLYGIYENQDDIKKFKTAIIFERRKKCFVI